MSRGLGLDRAGGASSGVAPGGPAGGDLSGTYPNPEVDGLQGVALSGTAPVDGDVIIFDGVSWKYSGSDSAGNTVVFNTASEAATITWGALATSVSLSQVQDGSAAGAVFSIRAQQGFAGFVGGDLNLGAGNGGTPGTNLPGATNINLGTPVGNQTGLLQLKQEDGTILLDVSKRAATQVFIRTPAGMTNGIAIQSLAGPAILQSNGGSLAIVESSGGAAMWCTAASVQWYQNSVLARTDVLAPLGAASITWAVGTTGITLTQTARATDASCAPFTITTQAPNAGATGTNRTPGQLNLNVPAAVGGGTEGKIYMQLGGATGVWFGKAPVIASTFGMVWDANATMTWAESGAGVNGFGLAMVGGSPAAVGARAQGGGIGIEGGDAAGNSGAAAKGGGVSLSGGTGSTSDGQGGDITITSGDGNTTNGPAGEIFLETGTPQGTGAKGYIHLGDDADTTTVVVRINGLTATTIGAAGAASALPLTPEGYLRINIKGTVRSIPYYLT